LQLKTVFWVATADSAGEVETGMANTDSNRRWFLGCLTNLVMAVVGLIVAIPALCYFLSPLRRRPGADGAEAVFQDAGPLSDIAVGQWRLLSMEMVHRDGWRTNRVRHAVWVRRRGEGSEGMMVLSSLCPHLACPINWYPDQRQFNCPCHGGVFDVDGRHTGGPPPRSMDPLEFEVRAGRLWVRWQDFKIGVAERVPVSV
jgi:menaquinol-cytochrome c reductase iron-sulfur subunit